MKTKTSILILIFFLLIYFVPNYLIHTLPSLNHKLSLADQYANPNLSDSSYPNDLVIALDQGNLSINRPSPFCLILDPKTNSGLVFDQNASSDPYSYTSNNFYPNLCRPFLLFGKNFIVYPQNQTFIVIQNPSFYNFSLKKSDLPTLIPFLIKVSRIVFYTIPFWGTFLALLFLLLNNYWYAFIVSTASKIFKIDTTASIKKYYGLTLFLFTLLIIFDLVIITALEAIFSTKIIYPFPLRNTILITVYTLYRQSKTKTLSPPAISS